MLTILAEHRGRITFGAGQASLTPTGSDPINEVGGYRSAEQLDHGSLEVAVIRQRAHEAGLKAERTTSSTSC